MHWVEANRGSRVCAETRTTMADMPCSGQKTSNQRWNKWGRAGKERRAHPGVVDVLGDGGDEPWEEYGDSDGDVRSNSGVDHVLAPFPASTAPDSRRRRSRRWWLCDLRALSSSSAASMATGVTKASLAISLGGEGNQRLERVGEQREEQRRKEGKGRNLGFDLGLWWGFCGGEKEDEGQRWCGGGWRGHTCCVTTWGSWHTEKRENGPPKRLAPGRKA
jgi:hypothetical protein